MRQVEIMKNIKCGDGFLKIALFTNLLLISVLSMAFLQGCSGTELTDAEYVELAKDYQDKGDLRASVIELKNALRINPENAEARWLLGQTYIEVGDGAAAEKELRRAGELGISQEGLVILLGKSLLLQGKAEQVLSDIQPLDTHSIQDKAEIHNLRGNAHLSRKNVEKAAESFHIALKLAPDLVSTQIGQARLAFANGNLEEAENWNNKALTSTPSSADAWSLIGDLKRYQENAKEAEEAYGKAIANRFYSPEDYLKRAIVRIYLGDYEGAESDIKALGQEIQGHPMFDYVQGYLFYSQEKFAEAQTAFDKSLSKSPDDMRAIFYLGAAHARQNHFEQADRYLSQFLNSYPNSDEAAKLLGLVRLSKGDYAGAETVLMSVLERDPNDGEALNLLGEAAIPQGKSKQSVEYFKRAIAQQSDSAPARLKLGLSLLIEDKYDESVQALIKAAEIDPTLQMADFLSIVAYLRGNEFDKAIEAAKRAHEKHPDSPHPLTLMAGAYLLKSDEVRAREYLQRALQVSPGEPTAAENLARLELKDGEHEKARTIYEEVIKYHPNHANTLVALAQLDARQGNIKEAVARLEYASKADPKALRPRVLLSGYYLRNGQASRVLDITRDFPESDTNPFVLGVIGEAQLAVNEAANAKETFSKLVDIIPDSERAHYLLSKAYASLKQMDDVQKELDQALAINPDYAPAKLAMARLHVGYNRLEEAEQLTRELEQAHPSHPDVFTLKGDLAVRQNRLKQAVEAYQESLKLAPSSQNTMKLALIQLQLGDSESGISTYKDWLHDNPSDVKVQYQLANTYLLLKRHDEAVSAFTRVVELSPDNVKALNNLAWLLRNDEPEKALKYAERALELVPNNPIVMDTLGALLIENGQTEKAVRLLEDASKKAPDNLDIRYHMALALVRSGDEIKARTILKEIFAEEQSFENKGEAEALLNRLGG